MTVCQRFAMVVIAIGLIVTLAGIGGYALVDGHIEVATATVAALAAALTKLVETD